MHGSFLRSHCKTVCALFRGCIVGPNERPIEDMSCQTKIQIVLQNVDYSIINTEFFFKKFTCLNVFTLFIIVVYDILVHYF